MKQKGFTMIEILATLVIVGIIITASSSVYNRIWLNSQIDIAENDLRDISNSFSSYMIDYGNITAENDMNYETVMTEMVELMNKQYLSTEIQIDEMAEDKKSVRFKTKVKNDPWKQKYEISIYTYAGEDRDSIAGLIIISSSGADQKSNKLTYKDGSFGDDIIAIAEPK